jgi:hypothetical protein
VIVGAVGVMAAVAALLQLAAVPSLFADGAVAPLLPVALISAWAAARDGNETWPVLLVVPVALGVVSEERVGWFMLALLPSAALASFMRQTDGVSGVRRFVRAPLAAAAGAVLYLSLLTLAAGRPAALADAAGSYALAALWTAAAAALLAAALWPLQPRPRGLFE